MHRLNQNTSETVHHALSVSTSVTMHTFPLVQASVHTMGPSSSDGT